jgi:hypothetical protein
MLEALGQFVVEDGRQGSLFPAAGLVLLPDPKRRLESFG